MTRSRCAPATLLAATLALFAPFLASPASALTTADQVFELIFTISDIQDADNPGIPIDPFILEDVTIELNSSPGFQTINESGTGSVDLNARSEFVNGALLTLGYAEIGLGDMFSTIQTQETTAGAAPGQALLFSDFGWNLGISNDSGVNLLFVFDWTYTRDMTLTEMDTGDSATVFLGDDLITVEDDNGPQTPFALFPDQMIPGNNPLNIGTLPPGVMFTLTDSDSFMVVVDGSSSQFTSIDIEWELGARSVQPLPEPSLAWLTLGGLVLALRLRR